MEDHGSAVGRHPPKKCQVHGENAGGLGFSGPNASNSQVTEERFPVLFHMAVGRITVDTAPPFMGDVPATFDCHHDLLQIEVDLMVTQNGQSLSLAAQGGSRLLKYS